ncbi:MAG TPA: MBL fold metallo-hydrolase [Candidatus Dormibacteraeota bacterium]|nr:MBL fold metallo-hydrolase [Candidatus Dormibacteraeota bacterium]
MRKLNAIYISLLSLLVLSLAFAPHSRAQAAPTDSLPFTLKPLGHNVYAAIDGPKGEAGANAGFIIGDDGVLVVDTFESADAAKTLLAEIRALTPLPVKYVVNTHYHLDHTGGNRVFQDAGAIVIAHRNVSGWIHTENLKFFGKNIKPEQTSLVEALGAPNVVYDHTVEVLLGSIPVHIHYFLGHTGGDSVVFLPSANVVFCGDLFWNQTLPNLIDASTEPWIATLDQIKKRAPSATFVPGHGDVGSAANVEAFRGYLQDIRSWTQAPAKAGKTGDVLANAVMPALQEKYGKWNFFQYFSRPNILDTAAEWSGTKKIPVQAKAD